MSRGKLFWGLILIIIGAAILLDNLGILQGISIWGIIGPLLLVAFGVWILWGGFFRRGADTEHVSISLEAAQSARIKLQHGAGRLAVQSDAPDGYLIEGDVAGGLEIQTNRQGDQLSVRMNPGGFSWFPGTTLDWNISLSNTVPLILEIESGASDSHLDLSELQLQELYLKSGASSTVLTLPAHAGFTRAHIESGAASMDVRIPDGVAAHIRSQGGLSSVTVDRDRFPRQGEVYRSADYDQASNKIDLEIQMGVGSVSVR